MERDEVVSAIEAADARIGALRVRLEQHADAPLLEGEWRVRDALSHLAARANPVPNVLRRLAAHEAGPTLPRPDIHEVNAGQVEERADRPIAQIIDEALASHRAALAALPAADVLAKMLPAFQGGEITVGETIARSGPGHEANHLSDIERALDALQA